MKIASYSRVSTSHHDQKPEIQVNEIRRFCGSKNWIVEHELVDHGFSGSTNNRPALKQLMQLVRSQQIHCVVVVKLDRLFRSLKHLITTLEEFERFNVQFVAIKDNVDYSTPTGRLFVQILGSLGEFERTLLRERTLMGLEHAKSRGAKFGRPRIHCEQQILALRDLGLTYRQIRSKIGVPMGSIARAIKNAHKSPTESSVEVEGHVAQNTVVLGADHKDTDNINLYEETDMSVSSEITEPFNQCIRNDSKD